MQIVINNPNNVYETKISPGHTLIFFYDANLRTYVRDGYVGTSTSLSSTWSRRAGGKT